MRSIKINGTSYPRKDRETNTKLTGGGGGGRGKGTASWERDWIGEKKPKKKKTSSLTKNTGG